MDVKIVPNTVHVVCARPVWFCWSQMVLTCTDKIRDKKEVNLEKWDNKNSFCGRKEMHLKHLCYCYFTYCHMCCLEAYVALPIFFGSPVIEYLFHWMRGQRNVCKHVVYWHSFGQTWLLQILYFLTSQIVLRDRKQWTLTSKY